MTDVTPAPFSSIPKTPVLAFGAIIILFVLSILTYYNVNSNTSTERFGQHESFHDCIAETTTQSKASINNLSDYIAIYNLCNDKLYRNFIYSDFAIRRNKFINQSLDERVNLWLVVVITISGVGLAGLQLILAYRLATSGKEFWANDTTFAVKQGEVSFKSSITGLAILALSLAFFFVYVYWIYTDHESGPALGVPVAIPLGRQLPPGSLGPPPPPAANKIDTLPTTPSNK